MQMAASHQLSKAEDKRHVDLNQVADSSSIQSYR